MSPQPQPESVPTDELDRWLEGQIREARRQGRGGRPSLPHRPEVVPPRPSASLIADAPLPQGGDGGM